MAEIPKDHESTELNIMSSRLVGLKKSISDFFQRISNVCTGKIEDKNVCINGVNISYAGVNIIFPLIGSKESGEHRSERWVVIAKYLPTGEIVIGQASEIGRFDEDTPILGERYLKVSEEDVQRSNPELFGKNA